jgi:hypothetical protein
MAVAVAYSFPVCLRYIAVAYRFSHTPLMIIPPMTYFLVVYINIVKITITLTLSNDVLP